MRGIPSGFLIFFFAAVFVVEAISYFGIRLLLSKSGRRIRFVASAFFITTFVVVSSLLLYFFSNPELIRQSRNYHLFYLVVLVGILNLVPKCFFSIATLLSFLVRFIRGKHLQFKVLTGSFVLSAGLFLVILYGIFSNTHKVELREVNLYFDNLPAQLEGFQIVQLSDVHLGTFQKDTRIIRQAASLTRSLNPDLVLFTGDIVNNFGEEIVGYEPYLKQFSGKLGTFAILGNHDYGDYYQWPDSAAKKANFELIKRGLVNSGFQLLSNQSVKINAKDTSLVLIGVENWGKKPFPQYADLHKAMANVPEKAFKILMSHDPAYWDAIVVPQTSIPLTLSGHTHGGQFGIKISGIEFSPMYFIQKYWGGLYEADNQFLYVNRGLGTIGFAGRIEMNPEVTLLILHRAKSH